MTAVVRRADPLDFVAFLEASDAYAASLYPAESNHMLDVETLRGPDVHFFGLYDGEEAKGCGALAQRNGYVEIKRLWIDPVARGSGFSKLLMQQLECQAQALGFAVARLETGVHQPEALGLYRKLGYAVCEPFGDYKPDPLSVFMEKKLS